MAVDFTKPDNFDASKNYKRVLFGEDGGITESELAELQKIQDQRLRDSIEALIGRVTALLSGTISYNGSTLTATSLVGYIDGELFQYSGSIALVNNDKVYLEVIESTIAYQQDPNLLDVRMGEETTRRIKNTYALKKTNTGTGKYFELGQILSGNFVETASRITPYADLGTDDINVIATKPASTSLTAYPYGVTVFKYLTGDAGYPVTNSTIMTFNNAQGTDGFQILYGYVSSKPVQYVRYFTGSAWGAWEKFATTADLATHASDMVSHITGAERAKWDASQLKKLTESNGYSLMVNNADMNTLRDTGFYYGSQMTNGPSGMTTGWILVHAVNANYCVQEFTVNTSSQSGIRRFWRVNFNGTWIPWNEYASTDLATQSVKGLMSPQDKTDLDNGQKFRLTQNDGIAKTLPSQSNDLNLITESGFYMIDGNALNQPLGVSFGVLIHIVRHSANYVQLYFQNGSGVHYSRAWNVGKWSEWKRQVTNLELGTVITAGQFVDNLMTNLVGKVPGSSTVNPNIVKRSAGGLLVPSDSGWIEAVATGGTGYERLQSPDGISFTQGASLSGQSASNLMSFNVLEMVQRTYGGIPGATTAEKFLWLRNNVSRITLNWTGFGASASGNKATLTRYDLAGFVTPITTTASSPSKLTYSVTLDGNPNRVSDFLRGTGDGFVHFVAYAEPSDGTTASVINTDFVELEIELKTNILNGLLDATPTVRGIMSATDKAKLDTVAMNANNYSHPSTHPATMIVEDSGHRFITDAERTTWNGKASTAVATTGANGLMSSGDKSKLDGIQAGAEVNQNSFAKFKVGSTIINASNKQDQLELVAGTNISLVGNASTDQVTVAVTGTVASSASTPWTGITEKPTKVEDFGITDVTLRYATTIQGQVWSRILEMSNASVFGHQFLVTIKGTRNSVVYKATLLVTTGHSQTAQIVQLNNINYSDLQVRAVVDTQGNGWLEVMDSISGIVSGTAQSVSVELIQIQDTNLVPLKTFTSGATIPANYAEKGLMTTVKNKAFVGDLVGNVTGDVTGDVTGALTGNASTATKLATARTISLAGDATGTVSFDGSGNVSLTVTVLDDSHNHTIANVDNLQTTLDTKETITNVSTKVAQAETNAKNASVPRNDSRVNSIDLNTYTTTGIFAIGTTVTNGPSGFAYGSLIVTASAGDRITQMALSPGQSKVYVRYGTGTTLTWSAWDDLAYSDVVTTGANGLMIASDKAKLDGISAGANRVTNPATNGVIAIDGTNTTVYAHPSTHPASIIVQDASNRFVTDAEKATWNGKASTAVATTSANGLMSSVDKTKLDGISTGANKVTNPATNGVIAIDGTNTTVYTHPSTHPATMITTDASNRFVTDTEKASWNAMMPRTGGTFTGPIAIQTAGASPLIVERTSASSNISIEFKHTGGSLFLGYGTDFKVRYASDANVNAGTALETEPGAQAKADNARDTATNYVNSLGLGTSGQSVPSNDCNSVMETGIYYTSAGTLNVPSGETYGKLLNMTRDSTNPRQHVFQMLFSLSSGKVYTRKSTDNSATWTPWSEVATSDVVTTTANGLMRYQDKSKLDGIATNANNYTHPSSHPPSIITQDSSNRFVTDAEKSMWTGKETPSGAQAKADSALNSAKAYAVNMTSVGSTADPNTTLEAYIMTNHANSPGQGLYWHILTQFYSTVSTTSNRAQIAQVYNSSNPRFFIRNYYSSYGWGAWNELAHNDLVTSTVDGLMRAGDKAKLDGIANNANNYTHPSSHPPSIISQDSNNRFVSDYEKQTWNNKASTAVVTTSYDGLMSSADKVKLDGAQFYKLMEDTGKRFFYANLNFATFEGFFYAETGASNTPDSSYGWFVNVMKKEQFIYQIAIGNTQYSRYMTRRSSDSGNTWEAWSEFGTSNLDWKTATLQSGHSALSGRAVKYAKDGNLLYIRGAISKDGPGTVGGDGNPIFTLPSGYRPKTVCYTVPAMLGTGSTSNYMNRLEVQTSGMVNLAFNWNAQYYGLDMIVPLD